MFILPIPNTGNGDKGRRHRTLGKSKEEADGGEACKILGSGKTHTDNAPDNP